MNKQTKFFKSKGWSLKMIKGAVVDNQDKDAGHIHIFERPSVSQPSKRKSPWKGCKSDRVIIYPSEFAGRSIK